MLTLSHHGFQFQVSEPYQAGAPVGPAEAHFLNLNRAERLRRRAQGLIEEAQAFAPQGKLTEGESAILALQIAKLDSEFVFEVYKDRSAAGASSKLLEAEIDSIIASQQTLARDRGGRVPSQAELKTDPEVIRAATRRVAAKQQVAAQALQELL